MKKLLIFAAVALAAPIFSSCDEDEDEIKLEYRSPYNLYCLNEGNWGKNDASICAYHVSDKQTDWYPTFDDFEPDIYFDKNNKNLGDQAQDLVYGDNHCLYVSVSGSKYIAKLNAYGNELARYATTDEQAEPRSLVLEGGKLYASMYGGMVARFDTATLTLEATVKVGTYPEEMAVNNGMLVVCNSGYGAENTLSVIDLKSFSVTKTVELPHMNPQDIVVSNGKFYCNTTEYDEFWNANSYIIEVNPNGWSSKEIAEAFYMRPYENTLYLIKSSTNWATNKTVCSFMTYDTAAGKLGGSFLTKETEDYLADVNFQPYGISINPINGAMFLHNIYYDWETGIHTYTALCYVNPDTKEIMTYGSSGVYCSKIVFVE